MAGAGKATVGDLCFDHRIDRASPNAFEIAPSGYSRGHRPHRNPANAGCQRSIRMDPTSRVLLWSEGAHRFAPHFHAQFFVAVAASATSNAVEARGLPVQEISYSFPHSRCTQPASDGFAYRAVYVGAALLDQFQMIFQSGPGDQRCGDVVVPSSPLAPGLLDAIERQDVGSILSIVGSIIERHVWSTRPAFPPATTAAHPLLGMMHEAVERHLSIGDIAASLQMSAESLSRTFHRTFGMPAVFYRNQLRLQAAEDLLSFGMPAAEVAAHCGYADQSHFVRELKKARVGNAEPVRRQLSPAHLSAGFGSRKNFQDGRSTQQEKLHEPLRGSGSASRRSCQYMGRFWDGFRWFCRKEAVTDGSRELATDSRRALRMPRPLYRETCHSCDDPIGLTCSIDVARRWGGAKEVAPFASFEAASAAEGGRRRRLSCPGRLPSPEWLHHGLRIECVSSVHHDD